MNLGSIIVGDRLREDMGDLAELAESINRYGLLHPVVIDADFNLIAGHRRLEACKHLGWQDVPVRELGELTPAERREIELEENLRRKDLTAYERSKVTVQLVETAREIVRETPTNSVQVSKPARGPSPEPDSRRAVAARTGIPAMTQVDAQHHVETAEAYPFMQRPEWAQSDVLKAAKQLQTLPPTEREKVATLIDQPGIPPKVALPVLANVAAMQPEERERIYELAESDDERDRTLALTKAAKMPPMPQPVVLVLTDCLHKLRGMSKRYPNDEWAPDLMVAIEQLEALSKRIGEAANHG